MHSLRPLQNRAVNLTHKELREHRKVLLVSPTGCHAAGQHVLMFDGSTKAVEDIRPGDQLMGPDSKPRNVLHLCRGKEPMAAIIPTKGSPWIVNLSHVLSLTRTRSRETLSNGVKAGTSGILNITVRDWLKLSKWQKHLHKLYRTKHIKFPAVAVGSIEYWKEMETPIDPYFLGVLLGDGSVVRSISVTTADKEIKQTVEAQALNWGLNVKADAKKSNCESFNMRYKKGRRNPLIETIKRMQLRKKTSGDKFIPPGYKRGPIETRKQVLAGLMDTDGSLSGGCYDFVSKSPQLALDVAFIARSLGLAAYTVPCEKQSQFGGGGTYHRVTISGNCNIIPCRIPRKIAQPRQQKKNVLRTGFHVELLHEDEFFGFTLDGDGLYLLDDFTVTHNSGKAVLCTWWCLHGAAKGRKILVVTDRKLLVDQMLSQCEAAGVETGVIMAKEPRMESAPVQIASLQTLKRRNWKELPPADCVMVDEADRESAAYSILFSHYPMARVIGFTATPVGAEGRSLLGMYDKVIEGMRNSDLLSSGLLLRTKVMAPFEPDIKGIAIEAGKEFNQNQLGKRVEECIVFADVFQWYQPLSHLQTICFVPRLVYARGIAAQFRQKGIMAEVIEGATKKREREEMLDRFSSGKTRVLVSVDVLTRGFDAPVAQVGIDLQPNHQFRSFWQKVGRIRRIHKNQKIAHWLDFAGNMWRFWHPDDDVPWNEVTSEVTVSQVMKKHRANGTLRPPWCCRDCSYTLAPWERIHGGKCPCCGRPIRKPMRKVKFRNGTMELVPIDVQKKKKKASQDQAAWDKCRYIAHNTGKTLEFAKWMYRRQTGKDPNGDLKYCPHAKSPYWNLKPAAVYPWMQKK